MKYTAILFDFDGTLINTNKLIQESYRHTYRKLYNKDITVEEMMPFWGRTLKDVAQNIDPENATTLISTYREFNFKNHDDYVTLFPMVQELLKKLKTKGIKLGIVTNKMRHTTLKGADLFEITELFDVIVAQCDVQNHKPHPEPILKALEALNLPPEEVLMVGDSPHDIESAHAANIDVAAVDWSLYTKEELMKYHPHYHLYSLTELLSLI